MAIAQSLLESPQVLHVAAHEPLERTDHLKVKPMLGPGKIQPPPSLFPEKNPNVVLVGEAAFASELLDPSFHAAGSSKIVDMPRGGAGIAPFRGGIA
jgi:hypothetical protein